MRTILIAALVTLFAFSTSATAHPNGTCHFHGTVQHCK
jgi:type 1 fimbria pilin